MTFLPICPLQGFSYEILAEGHFVPGAGSLGDGGTFQGERSLERNNEGLRRKARCCMAKE